MEESNGNAPTCGPLYPAITGTGQDKASHQSPVWEGGQWPKDNKSWAVTCRSKMALKRNRPVRPCPAFSCESPPPPTRPQDF